MAKELGITSELAPVASIALGTQNVSVLDMANAYSTLARGGIRIDPQVITKVTMNDTVLPDDPAQGRPGAGEGRRPTRSTSPSSRSSTRGSGTGAQVAGTKVQGQDRHHRGLRRRLVRRLHPLAHRRRVDGLPGGPEPSSCSTSTAWRKVNGGSLPARIFQRFMSGLPPENDDTATPAPEFTGRALSPIIRYTTPAPPHGRRHRRRSRPNRSRSSQPDGSVTLSGRPPRSPSQRRPTPAAGERDATADGAGHQPTTTTPRPRSTPRPTVRPPPAAGHRPRPPGPCRRA